MIGDLVRAVLSECGDFVEAVIVVDDGSSDATGSNAEAAGARVVRHAENRGYGAALKTGIREAETEFVVTMDSDGQHQPAEVKQVWKKRGSNDMTVGQRKGLIHSRVWRMPGKWMLWAMANYLTKRRIPDLNSGLRIFRREVILRYLHLCPAGFSFSTTSTLVMFNRGYSVNYVPFEIADRQGAPSTVTIQTGFDTIIMILRLATLFNPLRIFLPMSILMVLAGVAWGLPMVIQREGVSVGALLAIVSGLLFFSIGLLSDQISQMRLERYEGGSAHGLSTKGE